MKRRALSCAVVALGALASTTAAAQDQAAWLKDRRYTEGAGYRAGDLEIHPGLAGEFGYDSNYFLRATNEKPVVDALKFRLTPTLSLSTLGPQRRGVDPATAEPPKVNFSAGVAATYSEFISPSSDTAKTDALKDKRNVQGSLTLKLQFAPGRPVSVDLLGDVLRGVQPSNNPDVNYNRWEGRSGAGLTFTPGGGIFDARVGYQYSFVKFSDSSFGQFDNTQSQVNWRSRWRFFPRTALFSDASLGFLSYSNASTSLHDSHPVRARLGLNGLVTSSFALLAAAGWGSSFYQDRGVPTRQFNNVIGQAELKFYLTPNPSNDPTAASMLLSSIAFGYNRDFFNSYLGDFYQSDRIYGNLQYFFGGRFLVTLDGGFAFISYPDIFSSDAAFATKGALRSKPFRDNRIDSTLFAEYRLADSFGINVTGRYSANVSPKKGADGIATGGGAAPDDLNWNRAEAYVGVRWFM